jgi:DNA-binding XRE family transcriptional regulator
MSKVSRELCLRFAEARRAKGLRQTELAAQVGCTQSALSMFESGQPTKLSEETVKKLSDLLGVSLFEEASPLVAAAATGLQDAINAVHGFCPNCQCPSNVPYVVDGRLFYRPSRTVASPTGGPRCTQCGELLEMRCPSCGAPLNDGACCAVCGSRYVTPSITEEMDVVAYARMRREEIIQFRELK